MNTMKKTTFPLDNETMRALAPVLELEPEKFLEIVEKADEGQLVNEKTRCFFSALNRLCSKHGTEAVIHALNGMEA